MISGIAICAPHDDCFRGAAYAAKSISWRWQGRGRGAVGSSEEVQALEPDLPNAKVGAVGAHAGGSPHAFELHTFSPEANVFEDQVCGSMNASGVQWLTTTAKTPANYRASRRPLMGRSGEHAVRFQGRMVWAGGTASILY